MEIRTLSRLLLTRPALMGAALLVPLATLSTGAALAGHNPITAPFAAVTSLATLDETPVTTAEGDPTETPTDTPTETGTPEPTETGTPDGTETPSPTETATPPSVAAAHTNGLGCDDVLFANGRGPGGPVGCEVGNSGAHRKNGAKSTETATATPGDTATATPTEPGDDGDEDTSFDPHANGKGCDDILATNGRGPGGPVGCEVGNSGTHRQNGAKHATATPTDPASNATSEPGGETSMTESGSKVHGANGNSAQKGDNGNGKGKGQSGSHPGNGNAHGKQK